MDEETIDYGHVMYPSKHSTVMIALISGGIGVVVSTATFLLAKIAVTKSFDGVNIMLQEEFDLTLKDNPSL